MSVTGMGGRIRRAREALGWTQERLAEAVNRTRATIYNWENDINRPRLDEVPGLAATLGVTVDYIVTGKGVQPVGRRSAPAAVLPAAAASPDPAAMARLQRFAAILDNLEVILAGAGLDEEPLDERRVATAYQMAFDLLGGEPLSDHRPTPAQKRDLLRQLRLLVRYLTARSPAASGSDGGT